MSEHRVRNIPPRCSAAAEEDALLGLADDVGSLWAGGGVPTLDGPPASLAFLRDYVSKSRPCVIRNCIPLRGRGGEGGERREVGGGSREAVLPCLTLTLDGLAEACERAGGAAAGLTLTCDATPDGHGDCVRTCSDQQSGRRKVFVTPEEREMSLEDFRARLRRGREGRPRPRPRRLRDDETADAGDDGLAIYPILDGDGDGDGDGDVLYYSRQNDCLRRELKPVFDLDLFPPTFAFAEEAFGTGPPDAINMWIGDERATSSMHKDHYENLFYVLSGEKVFLLCPPADVPFLPEGEFDSGRFRRDRHGEGGWCVVPDRDGAGGGGAAAAGARVKWIEPDLADPRSASRFPLLDHCHPIEVRVREGEMIYLPALWFHRVTQSCETVGLNYWYDMAFDSPGWVYFNFLQQIEVACNE